MKENISPEEKLLRLIRGQKKDTSQPQGAKRVKSANAVNALLERILTYEYIHKFVLAVFVASCLYLLVSLVYPFLGTKRINLPKVTSQNIESQIQKSSHAKPFESYLQDIKGRQVFGSSNVEIAEKPAVGANTDLIKDINLVGIVSGDNPQAIVEDKKSQKTFYLTKGQFISEFQVEDIKEGKVILNFQGQKFELYL